MPSFTEKNHSVPQQSKEMSEKAGKVMGEAMGATMNKGEKLRKKASEGASSMVQNIQGRTFGVVHKAGEVPDVLLGTIESWIHTLRDSMKGNILGRTSVLAAIATIVAPITGLLGWLVGTCGVTLGIWAVAEACLIGVGILFMLPFILGAACLSMGMAGTYLTAAAAYRLVTRGTFRMVKAADNDDEGNGWPRKHLELSEDIARQSEWEPTEKEKTGESRTKKDSGWGEEEEYMKEGSDRGPSGGKGKGRSKEERQRATGGDNTPDYFRQSGEDTSDKVERMVDQADESIQEGAAKTYEAAQKGMGKAYDGAQEGMDRVGQMGATTVETVQAGASGLMRGVRHGYGERRENE
ncbi:hypothetical protein BJ684DRAFT_14913 [Piptocephalis cylindrospora]|uniref:Uncharacterized protein n=1 Tax=Piptocephalis cylindrospora TaxID=1907219 RepID=A0A4P9Y6Q5_9FUNG|nr:hypothetical protein BJ684DRAFT_14913 [Piptocephalis cylindrospora]|eukprot:RKP14778.1 hypothetical protein BJ684DRAFT_14913 [Piptocephalis cylindrospora]